MHRSDLILNFCKSLVFQPDVILNDATPSQPVAVYIYVVKNKQMTNDGTCNAGTCLVQGANVNYRWRYSLMHFLICAANERLTFYTRLDSRQTEGTITQDIVLNHFLAKTCK